MRSITDIRVERIIGVARVPRVVPIAFGIAGGLAMLMIAIQRLPGAERIVVEKPNIKEAQFDAAWADNFQTAVLKKQDRVRTIEIDRAQIASNEPVPVKTETVRPDPSPAVPKLVALPDDALDETGTEPKYSKRTRRMRVAHAESNVCTRHHMRKVVTRGGRSWRCR
jgi:hypothetical protein